MTTNLSVRSRLEALSKKHLLELAEDADAKPKDEAQLAEEEKQKEDEKEKEFSERLSKSRHFGEYSKSIEDRMCAMEETQTAIKEGQEAITKTLELMAAKGK